MSIDSSHKEPATPSKMPDRPELWSQLENAINLRSSEDQVLWSIFGTFWAANAILLIALFTTGDLPSNPTVGVVIASVGTALSLIWHGIQSRALGHVKRHEELMKTLEEELQIPPCFAVSAEINRSSYDQYLRRGFRARTLMPLCSLGGAVLWILALIFFVVKVLKLNGLTKWWWQC